MSTFGVGQRPAAVAIGRKAEALVNEFIALTPPAPSPNRPRSASSRSFCTLFRDRLSGRLNTAASYSSKSLARLSVSSDPFLWPITLWAISIWSASLDADRSESGRRPASDAVIGRDVEAHDGEFVEATTLA